MKVKRIIEIEEYHIKELQEYCKGEHHGQLRFEIISSAFSSIAHSKPYNPSGDCISREALRKTLDELFKRGGYDSGLVMDAIDNAQAVEPNITNDDLQAAMTESYHLGYELAETKFNRPQGEWEDYSVDFYKCPDCGYLLEKCCPQCQNKVILPKGGAE